MNAASRPDDWRAGGFVCCRCRDTGRRWEQVHIAGEVGKVNEIVEFRVTECPDCNEFAVRGTTASRAAKPYRECTGWPSWSASARKENMSRYGYDSDHRQGERDFERNGRYGYDERRYLGHERDDRDYRDGFDEARRADERRREEREQEEAAERRREYEREQQRRHQAEEEEAEYEARRQEEEQAESEANASRQFREELA